MKHSLQINPRGILLAILMTGIVLTSYAGSLFEEKLNLERSIQERTERIVEKIIGSHEMVVLVNVDLEMESAPVIEEPKASSYPGMQMSEEEYLPGITYSYLQMENSAGKAPQKISIKKITVLVTLDKGASDALSNRLKKEVNELLGLNPVRGDVVNIQKIAFSHQQVTWKDQVMGHSIELYWLFALFLATIFLFGPLRGFFKTVVKAVEIRIESDTRLKTAEQAGYNAMSSPVNPMLTGGTTDLSDRYRREKDEHDLPSRRFSFIGEDNLKNLIYLIKKESPEIIAVIISYLPPHIASQVLGSLTAHIQSQVAISLSQVKLLDPQQVDSIEQDIKNKIDYLLGGEEYFLNLLDQVDKETQDNILNTLEQENPGLAERLKRSLFFFEDIVILEKTAIQRAIREAQRRNISVALALKMASDAIKNKVMESLTEGAQAMLAEQIDLLGDLPEKRIMEEQRQLASLVRELEKTGEITVDRTKKFTRNNNAMNA